VGRRARLAVLSSSAAPQPLAEAVRSFLRRGEARNLSPHTLSYYRTRLETFTRYLEKRGLCLSPREVAPALLRDFLADERERVSAVTAGDSFITLRAFFRHLVSEEVLVESPMEKVEKIRVPRKLIETFTAEQVEAMLGMCTKSFQGVRLRALLLTLLDTGLRVSELCGLTMDDVSWDEQTLRVMGKGMRERRVPFGQAARQALLSYIAKRGTLPAQPALFVTCYGDPLDRYRVRKLLRACGAKAGVQGVRCSPHTFRHTCAVMFLRNGGDAFSLQKLLGHSSLDMTRRYAEVAQADVVAKHRQASPGDRFLAAVARGGGRRRLR
jgi:integrase/recombinase XerD